MNWSHDISDLLSIGLQEVLAEIPLTWSLAGPLISRTKSTWSKAFSEHRCWGQAEVLMGCTTRSASYCRSWNTPARCFTPCSRSWHLVFTHFPTSDEISTEVLGSICMSIFFARGVASPSVIKAWHSNLWCEVREISEESDEAETSHKNRWRCLGPVGRTSYLQKRYCTPYWVRRTSVLRRLCALIIGSQPGVEELLDVDLRLPHSADQALLSRQLAPLSRMIFRSEIC